MRKAANLRKRVIWNIGILDYWNIEKKVIFFLIETRALKCVLY
jgi:hypothetical protein